MLHRYVASLPPGLLVTAALLYSMQMLIAESGASVSPPGSRTPMFLRQAVVPDPPLPPAEPPLRELKRVDPPPTSRVSVPSVEAFVLPSKPGRGVHPLPGSREMQPVLLPDDQPLVALVRIEPEYPPAAAMRELEGFVIVRFDVSAAGTVDNVRIVSSSHRVFEQAATRAAERFRYQARRVDGTAVATKDIETRFSFRLRESAR